MTSGEYNPDFHWSPEQSLEMAFGDVILHLAWGNTTVYKYTVGNGRYDHIEHIDSEGETYQFFSSDEPLKDDLERLGYKCVINPLVPGDLVAARNLHDIDIADEFAEDLESIIGPDDIADETA